MSCVRLLVPAGFWHVSVNLPTAGILDVQRYPLSEAGEQRRGKAEAGSSCDMCLFSEIRLRSSCSLTCCLLLIIILFLYLSLQKHTHTLAPAAWQPLVSFTQLLCCFSHSQHPPPHTHTASGLDAAAKTCLLSFYYPSIHLPPRLVKWIPQNVAGIPQLGQEEERCRLAAPGH